MRITSTCGSSHREGLIGSPSADSMKRRPFKFHENPVPEKMDHAICDGIDCKGNLAVHYFSIYMIFDSSG